MQNIRAIATIILAACAIASYGQAFAQTPQEPVTGGPSTLGPDQSDLDLSIRRGAIATTAALCGMRDDRWAEDLRKGAVQDATHIQAPDDASLAAAPGANLTASALGFADVQATENFAEASPKVACQKLAADPGLAAADRRVALYRAELSRAKPGS